MEQNTHPFVPSLLPLTFDHSYFSPSFQLSPFSGVRGKNTPSVINVTKLVFRNKHSNGLESVVPLSEGPDNFKKGIEQTKITSPLSHPSFPLLLLTRFFFLSIFLQSSLSGFRRKYTKHNQYYEIFMPMARNFLKMRQSKREEAPPWSYGFLPFNIVILLFFLPSLLLSPLL